MILALGMILDALLGEPKWLWFRLPHPAVLMGRAVAALDRQLNKGSRRKIRGVIAMILLVSPALLIGLALHLLPYKVAEVLVLTILLAQRSLADHVSAVADALRLSLSDGKRSVAMIVGRDTSDMDQSDVARSAIESAAENLSDGVIAPIFWFFVAGLPGLLIYKFTNTADSMIGYKTERHKDFGWAAARFDDLLNLIPARMTAILIWLTQPRSESVQPIRAEAPKHRSPNAGWPEAAAAYHLDVALSGPRTYDGRRVDYPFVNANGRRTLGPSDIDAAVRLLWSTWALCLLIVIAVSLF